MAGSWLEITNRDDLGANLKAPQTDESGHEYWSYSLIKSVKGGDRVLHYHKPAKAIVASSRAVGSAFEDTIVWGARGTSARLTQTIPHVRPGWTLGVEDFRMLEIPITLATLRGREGDVREVLKIGTGSEGLYLPFAFSDKRPLRPSQGYLTRWPAELDAVLGLDLGLPSVAAEEEDLLGAEYRRADEEAAVSTREPFEVDPAVVEKGVRSHAETQNLLADLLLKHGIKPRSPKPGEPSYDLAWVHGKKIVVAEVKSLSISNEERQLRLGLGQVLRYRQILTEDAESVAAVIAVPRKPIDPRWLVLCASLDVIIVWPSNLGKLAEEGLIPAGD